MPKDQLKRIIDTKREVIAVRGAGSGSNGGGGGGGGGVTDHGALTGLSDDDHTQYFNQVRGDARYVPNTRVLTAGSGLTGGGNLSADRSFAVALDSAGAVEFNSNAIRVKLSTPSYLSRTVTGLAVTSHDIISLHEVSGGANLDVIGLSAPGVLARLTPAQDVSAGIGRILRSSDTGGLLLKSLQVRGTVNITDGGDLVVGSNIFFVDASQGNVGINRAPDQQFDLDVAGAIRGQYLVGKHALEIRDVMHLCQYNGYAPYITNSEGDPGGHRTGAQYPASSGHIFRLGKFDKCIQLAEATVNYVANPSFHANTTGWTHAMGGGSGGSFTRTANTTDGEWYGNFVGVLKANTTGTSDSVADCSNIVSVANGATVTASVWLLAGATQTGAVNLMDSGTSTVYSTVNFAALPNGLSRAVITWTNGTGSAKTVRLRVNHTTGDGSNVLFSNAQVELKAYATPYADSTMARHTTTGSDHVRNEAVVYYDPASTAPFRYGTYMGWVKAQGDGVNVKTIWLTLSGGTGSIWVRLLANGNIACSWGTAGAITAAYPTDGDWHYVCVTFNGTTQTLYIDGAQVATSFPTGWTGVPSNLLVGTSWGSNSLNGYLDCFVTVSRVLPAKEVLSIFESQAPVFAVSSVMSFRFTEAALGWVDHEGFWVQNRAGNPVFGIYGGLASGKSWGGASLDTGDLIIGNYTAGKYVLWDDSAQSMIWGAQTVPGSAIVNGGVTGTQIATTTITGGHIQTNTITAAHINVANLAAIKADLGAVTAGSIVVGLANKLWLNEGGDGVLAVGGATKATAPFRVSVAGSLVALAGRIGGVNIGDDSSGAGDFGYLYSGSGSSTVGMAGSSSGGHITIFWGGASYAGRNTAPFRVTNQGNLHVSAVVTSLSGQPLNVWSYSDGVSAGSKLASFYRPTGSTSGVAVGHHTNRMTLIRGDNANDVAYLSNEGTGSLEVNTNGSRAAVFQSTGEFSTHKATGETLGRITSTGVLRSRREQGSAVIAAYSPEVNTSVSSESGVGLGTLWGLMYVISSSGQSALLLLNGTNAPIIIMQTSGNEFSTTFNIFERTNIYYSGGLFIQNRYASTRTYSIHFFAGPSF